MALALTGLGKGVAVTVTLASAAWLTLAMWGSQRPAGVPARVEGAQVPASSARLQVPVRGVRPEQLADTFNQARSEGRRHDAIDIAAPRGAPVIAAGPGVVEKLFLSKAGGNTVYVRSPDRRTLHYYAHLDAYAPGLHEGATLRAGDPIGTVGSTGNADPAAPHLHFAVFAVPPERKWWEAAIALNPYPLLTAR